MAVQLTARENQRTVDRGRFREIEVVRRRCMSNLQQKLVTLDSCILQAVLQINGCEMVVGCVCSLLCTGSCYHSVVYKVTAKEIFSPPLPK